ncbi:MAG: hypothetical protein ABEK59_02535 [Halobacteria archaeon]
MKKKTVYYLVFTALGIVITVSLAVVYFAQFKLTNIATTLGIEKHLTVTQQGEIDKLESYRIYGGTVLLAAVLATGYISAKFKKLGYDRKEETKKAFSVGFGCLLGGVTTYFTAADHLSTYAITLSLTTVGAVIVGWFGLSLLLKQYY